MTKKIFRSIFLVAGIVLLACVIIIMLVFYEYFTYIQQNRLKAQVLLVSHGLERDGESYLDGLETDGYRITLIDPSGDVIYDSDASSESMENHSFREEIRQAREHGVGESERTSSTLNKKTLYFAKLLSNGNIVRMSITSYSVWTLLLGMAQPIAVVIITALVLSAVLALHLSKNIVEPLNGIDFDEPLENECYEELSPLLTRLERQRRQIDSQIKKLNRSQDEFNSIIRNMNEGLILLNDKGTVLSINSAAAKLFRVSEECVGQNILTIDRSVDMQEIIKKARDGIHGETVMTFSGREYQVNANPVIFDGRVTGVCVLAFDITEKSQAEQRRREFSANVSHELKTPLHTIMGSAELIENGLAKNKDVHKFAGNIRTEALRLVTLIDDIIRLSQLDEGSQPVREDIDLKILAQEVISTLSNEASLKNIKLELSGESAMVNAVRQLLYEVVYNLCDNAIKYNKQDGRVEILISRHEGFSVIKVSDTGIGIPAEHKPRIFERFYRVDKSHSRNTGGTGLGLSIVKNAAQYHKADISLETKEGKGTSITISFPDNNS